MKDRAALSLVPSGPAAPASPLNSGPATVPGSVVAEKLWTIREVAGWLSMTEMAVRAMLKRRQFPQAALLKFGRRVRFRSDILRDWALRQRSA